MSLRDTDWSRTSFADATEAAIHHELIRFHLDLEDREREQGKFCDLSDIYIAHRRTIRALADGTQDPWEYLESLD